MAQGKNGGSPKNKGSKQAGSKNNQGKAKNKAGGSKKPINQKRINEAGEAIDKRKTEPTTIKMTCSMCKKCFDGMGLLDAHQHKVCKTGLRNGRP